MVILNEQWWQEMGNHFHFTQVKCTPALNSPNSASSNSFMILTSLLCSSSSLAIFCCLLCSRYLSLCSSSRCTCIAISWKRTIFYDKPSYVFIKQRGISVKKHTVIPELKTSNFIVFKYSENFCFSHSTSSSVSISSKYMTEINSMLPRLFAFVFLVLSALVFPVLLSFYVIHLWATAFALWNNPTSLRIKTHPEFWWTFKNCIVQ